MAKCTESWDNCSGFFDCIGPAFETAATCTASYFENATHQALQFHRNACHGAITCTFDKYLQGKLTKSAMLSAMQDYYGATTECAGQLGPCWAFWTRAGGALVFPESWPVGAAPDAVVLKAKQEAQSKASQSLPKGVGSAAAFGAQVTAPIVGSLFEKGFRTTTIEQFSTGPCPQFSKTDLKNAIKDTLSTYFKTVATIQGGEAKKAFDAVQSLAAGSPSGVVMEALYGLLSDYGIEVPEEVKKFLNCLYSKAGGLVFTAVKQAVIDGDPKGAAQLLAPYAIACSAKTAKDSLEAGSIWAPLIDAIALAAVVATAPPPPPAPKVPVVDAKSECEQTGGIVLKNGACFKLDEKSIGFAAYASSGEVLKAQEKIYNAAAEGVKKKNEEKKKQEEQQQLLLIAGAAVVAYLALS